jgi:hypothetical protein
VDEEPSSGSLPAVEVCAPPELLTFISGTDWLVSVASLLADDEEFVAEVSGAEVPDVVSDPALGEPDDDEESDVAGPGDDDDSGSSANATPGVVATATPTPSATAKAPTRPMCLAYPMVVLSPGSSLANGRPSCWTERKYAISGGVK